MIRPYGPVMAGSDGDRAKAMAALPEAYARALELRELGKSAADIAADLDVPVSAVPTMFRLADAKLRTILESADE